MKDLILAPSLGPREFQLFALEPGTQLIDVREYPEFAAGHLSGARLVPVGAIPTRLGELDPDRPVALICQTGRRSEAARQELAGRGFARVTQLAGGMNAWVAAGFPAERSANAPWSLERQVRIVAGLLVLLGVMLGFLVHPACFGLSAFVGAGLTFAGLTDWCGMGLLLAKMPWNRDQAPSRCAR